jgi:small neutral amino acid transporter SnatA (MarC family)
MIPVCVGPGAVTVVTVNPYTPTQYASSSQRFVQLLPVAGFHYKTIRVSLPILNVLGGNDSVSIVIKISFRGSRPPETMSQPMN